MRHLFLEAFLSLMIDDVVASFVSVSSACVDGEQQPQQQARGKGRTPEAGPRHGSAGLRVKPERAIASTAATAIEAAGSVTHLPCRAVCMAVSTRDCV